MTTYLIGSDGGDDYASWTAMQLEHNEAAGDTVSFRKAETFRETVTVPASGSSGSVITYTAHGSGADPIINGADLKTDPTDWMGYQHSDDFETGDTTKWDAVTEAGANALTIVEAAKQSGTYGMRCTFDGSNRACNVGVSLGAALTDVTVEFYIRLSDPFGMTATYAVHSMMNLGSVDVMLEQQGSGTFVIRADIRSPSSTLRSSALTPGTWYKVTYRFFSHASTGGHQLWLDDSSQASDFAKNTSAITVSTYYLGGVDWFNSIVDNGKYVDFDNVTLTTGGGENTNAYRSKNVGIGGVVIQDGLHLEPNVTSIATLTEGQYYTDGSSYEWVYPTGGGSPADYTMEMSARNHVIVANAKDYLTFQNLDVQGQLWNAMYFTACENIELDSCTIKNSKNYGITFDGEGDVFSVHDCTFREIAKRHINIDGTDTAGKNTLTAYSNTFTMDGEGFTCKDASASAQCYAFWCDNAHGSQIYSNTFTYLNFFDDGAVFDNTDMNMISMQGCDGIAIYGNTITGGRHGMQLDSCIGVDVYRNRINKTRDDFIWLYTNCSGTNNIYYNVCSYSGDDGIVLQVPANVYNNVVAYISDTGMIDFSTSNGSVIKNNIVYMWGTNSDDTTDGDKAFQTTANHTFTADNNCWFSNEAEAVQEWRDNPDDHNFAQWQAAGFDASGLNTDPLFTDPGNGDFTLQSGSPCMNKGAHVGLFVDYLGLPVPIGHCPDIGAYEHKGGGNAMFF